MYDMYPEAWPVGGERRQQQVERERPRRRVRKPHSVLPAVLGVGVKPARLPTDH